MGHVQLDMGVVLQHPDLRVGCVTDTVILLRNRIAVRLGFHGGISVLAFC
jgi:hypothetical protein